MPTAIQTPPARRKRSDATLPARFEPQFWKQNDGRSSMVRAVKDRVSELEGDSAADSIQKKLLCQRAAFLAIQLETAEVKAVTAGEFDAGTYTQGVNSLLGVLKAIGLERKAKKIESLASYVAERRK